MKIKLFFTFIFSLITAPLSAHFIAGSIWYKEIQGKRHWVYLLGDDHAINYLSSGELNSLRKQYRTLLSYEERQVNALKEYIDSQGTGNTAVFLELRAQDYQQYQASDAQFLQEHIFNLPTGTHQPNIFYRMYKQLPRELTQCLECRESQQTLSKLKNEAAVKEEFIQAVEAILQNSLDFLTRTITSYSNQILREYFNTIKIKFVADIEKLKGEIYQHNFSNEESHYNLYQDIQTVDADIFDVNLLDNLDKNQNKQHMYICAGNYHIQNIANVLPALGYKKHVDHHDTQSFIKRVSKYFSLSSEYPINVADFLNSTHQENPSSYGSLKKATAWSIAAAIYALPIVSLMRYFASLNEPTTLQDYAKIGLCGPLLATGVLMLTKSP